METSLNTGFAQIFSSCPKNLSCPKFGGAAAPLAPPARTAMDGRTHAREYSLLVHHEYPIFLPEVLCCIVHARARLSLFFDT